MAETQKKTFFQKIDEQLDVETKSTFYESINCIREKVQEALESALNISRKYESQENLNYKEIKNCLNTICTRTGYIIDTIIAMETGDLEY